MAVLDIAPQVGHELGVVAVLDDDAGQAKTARLQLGDLGVEALIIDLDEVPTLEDATAWVLAHAQALVCDVQLNNLHGNVAFTGAQLVAHLVSEHKIPCVLTTGFLIDVGMWVRPYRQNIPVLLTREETVEAEALLEGLSRCHDEIVHGRSDERRTDRVPLFVEKAGPAEQGMALDARVGGWAHRVPMRFPASLLAEEYEAEGRAYALVGQVFFARVNIGARRESDLFFEDPEPDVTDPTRLKLHFEEAQE